MISRCELFDEADLDTALARFDQLTRSTAAGKRGKPGSERVWTYFAARDWDAMVECSPTTFPRTIVVGS